MFGSGLDPDSAKPGFGLRKIFGSGLGSGSSEIRYPIRNNCKNNNGYFYFRCAKYENVMETKWKTENITRTVPKSQCCPGYKVRKKNKSDVTMTFVPLKRSPFRPPPPLVRRCNGTTAGLGYWKVGLEWPYNTPPGQ